MSTTSTPEAAEVLDRRRAPVPASLPSELLTRMRPIRLMTGRFVRFPGERLDTFVPTVPVWQKPRIIRDYRGMTRHPAAACAAAILDRLDAAELTFESLRHVGTFRGLNLSAVAVRADGLRIVQEVRRRRRQDNIGQGRDARDELHRWQTLADLQDRAEELLFGIVFPDMEHTASGPPLFASRPRSKEDRILGWTYTVADGDGAVEEMPAEAVALYEDVPPSYVRLLRRAAGADRIPDDRVMSLPTLWSGNGKPDTGKYTLSETVKRWEGEGGLPKQADRAATALLHMDGATSIGLDPTWTPGTGRTPHKRDADAAARRFAILAAEAELSPEEITPRRGRGNTPPPELVDIVAQMRDEGIDLRDIATATGRGKRTIERYLQDRERQQAAEVEHEEKNWQDAYWTPPVRWDAELNAIKRQLRDSELL